MAREAKKPDFDKLNVGINPFIQGLSIAVTKRKNEVFDKDGKFSIVDNDIEATAYTKVFMVEAAKYQVDILPIRSKELYLHLMHSIRAGTDYIWIDKAAYMKSMGIKSINTYKTAVNGLCECLYIAPHYNQAKFKDTYWINPHFFFKGSRINKYPENLLLKSKAKA